MAGAPKTVVVLGAMGMAMALLAASKDLPEGTTEAIDRSVKSKEEPDMPDLLNMTYGARDHGPGFVVTPGKGVHPPKQVRKERHKKRFRKRK